MLNISKKDVVTIGSVVFGIAGFAYGHTCEKRLKEWIRAYHSNYIVKYQEGDAFNPVKKIAFDSIGDAKKILADMQGYIKEYHDASISDYYQLAGVKCNENDFNFGWRDLKNARIVYDSSVYGYMIVFPKVIPLE